MHHVFDIFLGAVFGVVALTAVMVSTNTDPVTRAYCDVITSGPVDNVTCIVKHAF